MFCSKIRGFNFKYSSSEKFVANASLKGLKMVFIFNTLDWINLNFILEILWSCRFFISSDSSYVLKNFESVKEFIYQNPKLKPQIAKIIIKDNTRWDLITKNRTLFKLPLKNKQNAINEMNRIADMLNDEDRVIFLDKIVIHKNLKGLAS